jgi:hypothetical protein
MRSHNTVYNIRCTFTNCLYTKPNDQLAIELKHVAALEVDIK